MLLTDDEVELVEVDVDREVPEMDIVPNESRRTPDMLLRRRAKEDSGGFKAERIRNGAAGFFAIWY